MLDFNFNDETLSAVAGMTFWNFYFQLFPKSIRSPQVIEFLGHLKRYLRRPVLVLWDRLSAHQSRMTQQWIEEHEGLDSDRVPAGLCAGAEPGGIPMGLLEAARTAQRLPSRLLGAGRSSATSLETHPASPPHPDGLLEAILLGP